MTDDDKGKCKEFNPEWLKAQRIPMPYADAKELPPGSEVHHLTPAPDMPSYFSKPNELMLWCLNNGWETREVKLENPSRRKFYMIHPNHQPRCAVFPCESQGVAYGCVVVMEGPREAVVSLVKPPVHEHKHNPGLNERKDDIPNFQKGVKIVQDFIITPGSHSAKKFDDGKIRYELLPGQALEDIAHVFTFGAQKYGDFNWTNGLKFLRLFGALCRHSWAWYKGETYDKESGLHHLAHAAACCMMLVEQQERKDLDDRVSMRKVQGDVSAQFHGSEG